MHHKTPLALAAGCLVLAGSAAQAFTFETDNLKGAFDSTVTAGLGIRVQGPACGLLVEGGTRSGAPAACLAPTSGLGDQGNLNYGRGDPFTAYLKGTHELSLKLPAGVSMLARASWMRDVAATRTTGLLSSNAPADLSGGLTPEARESLRFQARLLDLWASKTFDIGGSQVRARLGNQVINWGESLFLGGGINVTNAMDFQRLSLPGTQIKEGLLPAPMLSVATGLGNGINFEGYWQFNWNKSFLPPAGSYFSTSEALGRGNSRYGSTEFDARNGGQWGLALRWQPANTALNLGAYAINYHDKTPQLRLNQTSFASEFVYLEDRRVYGVSANLPLGDWAVGAELSYRPRDAVAYSPLQGCTTRDGRCWVDSKRWQLNLTGIYSFTPSNARPFLEALGADGGTFLVELAAVHFPGLQDVDGGDPLAAGYGGWGLETDPTAALQIGGTRRSSGVAMNLSINYDGTLIDGWQVVPEIYWFQALGGRTPTLLQPFTRGNRSLNLQVAFIRNPALWQITLNYARFMGGRSPLDNALRDRDFVGLAVSRNF